MNLHRAVLEELFAAASDRSLSNERLAELASGYSAEGSSIQVLLSDFAAFVSQRFLDEQLSFDLANAALNWVMPIVGFENAPHRFWEAYIIFENFETTSDPDTKARAQVRELVASWHAA